MFDRFSARALVAQWCCRLRVGPERQGFLNRAAGSTVTGQEHITSSLAALIVPRHTSTIAVFYRLLSFGCRFLSFCVVWLSFFVVWSLSLFVVFSHVLTIFEIVCHLLSLFDIFFHFLSVLVVGTYPTKT